ncbi:hypothetical protein EI94DRAFT_1723986 [Lactarius quietus]|nr:hypothetical protein EI94DRAFT_1723986 [Lactarius quietus]
MSTVTGTQDVHESIPVPSQILNQPTNYLRVSRQGEISGQYLINLSIPPLPQSIPHVVHGIESLFVHTTNGTITSGVWLTGNNNFRQIFMKLYSDNGSVCAKIHDAFSIRERELRPSFDIELRAPKGDISLSLPRCFRGIMTVKPSWDKIRFSSAFGERTVLLSDVQGASVYFIGDRPRSWMLWGDENNDREGEESADTGRDPEKSLDKLFVSSWVDFEGMSTRAEGIRIGWEGEPELPSRRPGKIRY